MRGQKLEQAPRAVTRVGDGRAFAVEEPQIELQADGDAATAGGR
jgi:hypothetical protein